MSEMLFNGLSVGGRHGKRAHCSQGYRIVKKAPFFSAEKFMTHFFLGNL
jgi:hypothetical protein